MTASATPPMSPPMTIAPTPIGNITINLPDGTTVTRGIYVVFRDARGALIPPPASAYDPTTQGQAIREICAIMSAHIQLARTSVSAAANPLITRASYEDPAMEVGIYRAGVEVTQSRSSILRQDHTAAPPSQTHWENLERLFGIALHSVMISPFRPAALPRDDRFVSVSDRGRAGGAPASGPVASSSSATSVDDPEEDPDFESFFLSRHAKKR